ncbi:hypothetical protein [Thermotalea metallivorans]|uniref:Uncharacterized protein n=1 Tax=Thermotalea metallivorans TaxID=520762 RepID=A0A140L127_9FIRM|nr:hypothetical protein [Thermotalea metallivorans]KXG74252.1 hypothetical protein AN619_24440 [Thermotalea metallivorans]
MSRRIFTWIEDFFDDFVKTKSYKLGIRQKRLVAKGLGILLLAGIGLGIILGFVAYALGFMNY